MSPDREQRWNAVAVTMWLGLVAVAGGGTVLFLCTIAAVLMKGAP